MPVTSRGAHVPAVAGAPSRACARPGRKVIPSTAKVNRTCREPASAAAVTHVNQKEPGKASRVVGDRYHREVNVANGQCDTVVETWMGHRWHCRHGRRRSVCKACGGASICDHGRERSVCKACGGGSICGHGRKRSQCKECGGSSICEHGRVRSQCKQCKGAKRRKLGGAGATTPDAGAGGADYSRPLWAALLSQAGSSSLSC